jgi:hypothetical protein
MLSDIFYYAHGYGWVSDKSCELFVYELKISARRWSANKRLDSLADAFCLSGDIPVLRH